MAIIIIVSILYLHLKKISTILNKRTDDIEMNWKDEMAVQSYVSDENKMTRWFVGGENNNNGDEYSYSAHPKHAKF